MAYDVAFTLPGGGAPAWPRAVPAGAGIKPKPGNCHKYMAVSAVNRDPIPSSFFPVFEESLRGQAAFHQPSLAQDVGDAAGAVIAAVLVPRVPAAPLVGLALEAIARSDGFFHIGRGVARGVGDAVLEHRRASVVEPIGYGLLRLHLA